MKAPASPHSFSTSKGAVPAHSTPASHLDTLQDTCWTPWVGSELLGNPGALRAGQGMVQDRNKLQFHPAQWPWQCGTLGCAPCFGSAELSQDLGSRVQGAGEAAAPTFIPKLCASAAQGVQKVPACFTRSPLHQSSSEEKSPSFGCAGPSEKSQPSLAGAADTAPVLTE